MRRAARARTLAPLALLVALTAAGGASSQQAEQAEAVAEVEEPEVLVEPEAAAVLRRMVATLSDAERIRYRVEEEYDAVQTDDETISFGYVSEGAIRRPDRVRLERVERDGDHRILTYDGKDVTVLDVNLNVYASTPRTGDYDSVVDFLRDDVGLRLPVADLFARDLGALLLDNVESARYVGQETLRGVDVDHIAFRYGTGAGIQLWVERGERAVPHRMIITFEDALGRPQFRADFSDWDLSPRLRDSTFAFRAPKGARAIPFTLPKRAAAPAAAEEAVR